MLRYLDRTSQPIPPHWLRGASDLAHTVCKDGALWGVGHPALLGDAGPWKPCGDGIEIAGQQDPAELRRGRLWCEVVGAVDRADQIWSAPVILDRDGRRAFRVAYGDDWLPALSDEQVRAEAIAREARAALTGGQDPGTAVGCQWAAELLCITHHLTPKGIAALRLMDDMLMAQTLTIAAGLHDG